MRFTAVDAGGGFFDVNTEVAKKTGTESRPGSVLTRSGF